MRILKWLPLVNSTIQTSANIYLGFVVVYKIVINAYNIMVFYDLNSLWKKNHA